MELSSIAAIKLFAAVIAWISPVKWRLISSIGTTCAYPPPAAPPLIPKHGPSDGSRIATTDFFPNLLSACDNPIIVVVFPSPAGVGLIAVTKINFPSSFWSSFLIASREIFALYFPYNSRSSSSKPTFWATSTIGFIFALCAISTSVNIVVHPFFFSFWLILLTTFIILQDNMWN